MKVKTEAFLSFFYSIYSEPLVYVLLKISCLMAAFAVPLCDWPVSCGAYGQQLWWIWSAVEVDMELVQTILMVVLDQYAPPSLSYAAKDLSCVMQYNFSFLLSLASL